MDDNIRTLRDALLWLERRISEEAELDGEMTNAHAIQLGFITNMLEKFPLRQCDVGTEDELGMRFNAWCRKHYTPDALGGNCRKCPLKDRRGWSCQLAWAQMPYESEEARNDT